MRTVPEPSFSTAAQMESWESTANELIEWQDLARDLEKVLAALKKGVNNPHRTWQLLSRALDKYCNTGCLPASLPGPFNAQLPLLAANCTTAVLEHYKDHQPDRRKDLGQLCRLTGHLYHLSMGPAGQKDPSVQLSLAKQGKEIGLLTALQLKMHRTCVELLESAKDAYNAAVAGAAAATDARAAARRKAIAEDAVAALALDLQLAGCLLKLFKSISASWPGEVGIMSCQDAPLLTEAAARLANAIIKTVFISYIAAINAHVAVNAHVAEEALRATFDTVGQLSQQLYLMTNRSQQTLPGKQLLDCPALLQLYLTVILLQLGSAHAAADTCCVRCSSTAGGNIFSSDTPPGWLADSAGGSHQCSSCSNSLGTPAASLDCEHPVQPAVCLRCHCRRKLASVLQPLADTANPGVPYDLWQSHAAADDVERQLQLLKLLLEKMKERVSPDWEHYGRPKEQLDDKASKLTHALTVALLDLASFWCGSGQKQVAAAALDAARAAAAAWQDSSGLRGYPWRYRQPKRTQLIGPFDDLEVPCVQESVWQATHLLRQLSLLQADNSSSIKCYECMVSSLISLLTSAGEVATNLFQHEHERKEEKGQDAKHIVFQDLLQPAVAVVEAGLRTVAAAAEISAASNKAAGWLTIAGGRNPTYSAAVFAYPPVVPAAATSGSHSTASPAAEAAAAVEDDETATTAGQPSAAVNADKQHNPAYADKQLFALLVSLLKLQSPAFGIWVINRINTTAGNMLELLKDHQQVTAAMSASATLPYALPWLLLRARVMISQGQWIAQHLADLQQTAEGAGSGSMSATVPARNSDMQRADAKGKYMQLSEWARHLWVELYTFPRACSYLRVFLEQRQQQHMSSTSAQHPPAAATTPTAPLSLAAVAEVLQPELVLLLQQWDQHLLPQVEHALQLLDYARSCDEQLPEQPPQELQSLVKQLAAIDRKPCDDDHLPDDHEAFKGQLLIVAGCSLMQQLPQQLEAAGHELSALLPLPLCCNNPLCRNLSMQSELQLVGGKACVCAGCEVARYCGQECQAAHWQAHKRVCKLIKKTRLGKRAGSSSTTT